MPIKSLPISLSHTEFLLLRHLLTRIWIVSYWWTSGKGNMSWLYLLLFVTWHFSLWELRFLTVFECFECLSHFRSHDCMMNSWDNNSDWVLDKYSSWEITPQGKREKSYCLSQTGLDETRSGDRTGRSSQKELTLHELSGPFHVYFLSFWLLWEFVNPWKCLFYCPCNVLMK